MGIPFKEQTLKRQMNTIYSRNASNSSMQQIRFCKCWRYSSLLPIHMQLQPFAPE